MQGHPHAPVLSFALMIAIRARVVAGALSVVFGSVGAGQSPSVSPPSKRMLDGKQWTTKNLNATTEPSYCYDNSARNCRRYGRLYTWESAQQACRALGGGWRLPTNEDWRRLGSHYGGIRQESADLGKAAYTALMTGGNSGFNAVHGGGRTDKSGEYLRLEAHGFYWSATESSPDSAWFYNFGKGGQSFGRHENGEKLRAFSVRCVKE
jgi:uncharacterized protein (TIGR02145 family)